MEENTETIQNTNNSTKNNECQELKNIKYKTMLLNGAPIQETKSSNDLSNLDKFLIYFQAKDITKFYFHIFLNLCLSLFLSLFLL